MAFNSLLNAVKKGVTGLLKTNPFTAPIVNAAPQLKTAVTQTFPAIQKSIQSSPMASARPGETKAVPSTQQNQVTDAQLASARAQNPMPQVASAVAPAPATPRVGSLPVSQMSAEEKRMATLVNPQTGERKAVAVGSPDANSAFGQGFVLEGSQEETAARKMLGVGKPVGNLPSADNVSTGALAQEPPTSSAPVVAAEAEVDPLVALRQKYLGQFAPSDEERSLADKIAMTSETIAGLEGQGRGISLDMVRGQQGALRSKGLAPLEARLGALVGARQAEASQTGAMLGFAEKDAERAATQAQASKQQLQTLAQTAAQNGATAEQVQAILASGDYNTALQTATPFLSAKQKQDLISVSAGSTLYDPATGEAVYTAPKGGGDDWANTRLTPEEAAKRGVAFGTTYGELEGTMLEDPETKAKKQESQAIIDGSSTAFEDKLNLIDEIMSSKGLSGTVGTRWFNRLTPGKLDKAEKKVFLAQVEQLVDVETLNKLIEIKQQGGSLGAISDAELRILQSSATAISKYIEKDKDGNPTGNIKISEKLFEDEVNKLKDKTMAAVVRLHGFADLNHLKDVVGGEEELNRAVEEMGGIGAVAKAYAQGDDPNGLFHGGGSDSQGLFTNAQTQALNRSTGIGSLSEQFESKGDPGIIGYDTTGGYSYGTYQLAHDNARQFVTQSPYAREFAGLAFNSPQFRNKWAQVAKKDPTGFANAQKAYIAKTHYEPQLAKIERETGLKIARLSPAMKDVIWSTAVQHGANTPIVVSALKQLGRGASEAKVIDHIYNLRWSGGQQFQSSTPEVRQAVKNRFTQERQLALSRLNSRQMA